MSNVIAIEEAVSRLTREEFAEFECWFMRQRNRAWDEQMEADAASGALDFLEAEATAAAEQGTLRPAHEVFGNA